MQPTQQNISWTDANQASLVAEFDRLRQRLDPEARAQQAEPVEESRDTETPTAVDRVCELFGLSHFERQLLLLCAGVEMDSKLASACGAASGHPNRTAATFGLALAVLPDPHWSALTPVRPLRHYRLLELEAGHGLTSAPLRIDERILHYLAGINLLDQRLQPLIRTCPFPEWIAQGHQAVALRAAQTTVDHPDLVVHLCGDDPQGQQDTAAAAAHELGRQLFTVRMEDLPSAGPDLDQFDLLWQRESLLVPGALLIECGSAGLSAAARGLIERMPNPVMLASRDAVRLTRPCVRFTVDKPPATEQKWLWQKELGPAAAEFNGTVDAVSQQFRLSARAIHTTSGTVFSGEGPLEPADLWNACRAQARPKLEDMAQRIVPLAGWDDLVLPEPQKLTLRQLVSQIRHRMTVFETWGFAARGRRGLGIGALFCGESGTGKTLAAEVIAHELALDLYRIDLSSVVSKYIGETEKNLKQVFDAAEEGGVMMLFDESEAFFGKRGDVKDSHDRYANIEVSYLLQRMEAFQGLAILTSNLKSTMDRAFQRRLRFSVSFPFPDAQQRQAIWARMFPPQTPTRGLDAKKLSQLNMTGGHIRNIAINAAFLAADAGEPVEMQHVLQAARLEAQKVERPVSDSEIRGWV
jgi:hypothetical protein